MWPSWTGGVQKRVCRYLLSRYVGQYLEEKLSLDQLTVDLYNGTGTVTNVTLDCSALNGVAEQHSLPFELIEGHVETISVSVPWSTIMTDSCEIEITGMHITIQPKQRGETGNSMFDSMFTSMASSMQLAEECLKINDEVDDEQEEFASQEPLSGLEHCAQTIDAVLSRVKLCFRDTILRVEKCQKGDDVGVALEFHIKLWRYSDENFQDTNNDPTQTFDSAFSHKKIVLEGLTCYSDIFSSRVFGHVEENSNDQKEEPDNSVLIGKFAGRHEVRIQVKTDDSMSGPQVSVECNFGSLIAYLSPIQAHIVYRIVDELLNPVISDEGGNRKFCKEKPMDSFDFKRVEEELQEQLKPGVIGFPGLVQQQGWSTGGFNDDSDDEFLPLKSKAKMYQSSTSNIMINSMSSMLSSMQQSVTDSLASSTVKSSPYHYQGSTLGGLSTMQSSEKTKFTVTFASIAVALLHQDLLILSPTETVALSSVKDMRESSRRFFQSLSLFGVTVKGKKDVNEVREKLNSACDRSHHRIIAAPVKIEGLIKGTNSDTETVGYLILGYCEIVESLKYKTPMCSTPNPECIEVLTFPKNFEHGSSQSLKMEFKSKSCKTRLNNISKTYLKFYLQECHCEFDVSVIDRIYAVFYSPLQFTADAKAKILSPPQQKTHTLIKISVRCPLFSLNFRFPIPDMRSKDDINRTPYWIRNLRNDSVVAQLQEFDFSTILNSAIDTVELETKCHEIRLFYKESPLDTPVLFATALADDPDIDSASMRSQGLDWPRIVVLLSPERSAETSGEAEGSDDGEGMDSFFTGKPKGTSPFSSKTVIHESNHGDNSSASASVIPGNRTEMNDFIEATTRNVLFKIDISLRFLDVSFPSKHFFEEIYNRFGNDLLLWEPSRQKTPAELSFAATQIKHMSTPFSMCKSAIKLDPGSDSEDEMNTFYTPAGCGSMRFDNKPKKRSLGYGQSEVTVTLSVSKGAGSFFTPVQDTSGSIIPGQHGQLMITVQDACLFVVSSYKGDPLLGFMCLSSHKAEMKHSDLVRSVEMFPKLSSELLKTIFPSDRLVLTKKDLETNESDVDMLSVAIRIERDSTTNIKTFKVATGIREGTLDHRMYSANRSWFTQLTDFFDVTDTPIIGYIPSTVLTELHLHLWDCAIDYRPLNLPMRSVLTIDTFSISSNIAAQTSTSVIRFICEDSALFLTTKFDSNDLRNDYVCVMEMDYFDLSLRLCTNRSSTAPRIDLSASSNVLHIRTCSDSFKALVDILTYYSCEGDLIDPNRSTSSRSQDTGHGAPFACLKEASSEPALITTEETVERDRRMSVSTTEYVHDMVTEAIEDQDNHENPSKPSSSQPNTESGTIRKHPAAQYEIHFTPTADFNFNSEPYKDDSRGTTPLPLHGDPIFESVNGMPVDLQLSDEDEEKFCILEDDPGVGILPKHGEPEARVLTTEPIRLIENYFSPPAGKLDILKAPKHYPLPAMKYSLKEMTIIWHLYGGADFGAAPCRKSCAKSEEQGSSEMLFNNDTWKDQYGEQSDQVDVAIDVLNSGVMFSKTKAFESAWEAYESSPKASKFSEGSHSWRQQGGKGRKHDTLVELNLSKIKLIHEVYPESAEQASRQVIVINNIEIIDRLFTSQYNKMMYLYTSPSRPKQTNANMVVIKAAHIRPDPQLSMEECSLKISILPIRLNIDQDTILFLYTFFSDLSTRPGSEDGDSFNGRMTNPPSHTPSVESLPIMTVNFSESEGSSHNDGEDGSNLLMFGDEPFGAEDNVSTCSKDPSIDSTKPPAPVYFRQVIFSPAVPIRLDYRGKRVDMTHGPLAGLLMGLGQLNCSEITLKRISHRHGILGFDRLAAFIINDWATDIKKNQLPSLLGGVGPMHSFVQLFQGVRDLFWLPIEQYQKDGRIAKGLQRGVNSFSASTAMAALELTNKIIQTVQGAAEFTYDMVSPGPSVQQKRRQSSSKRKKKYSQPSDIREGMTNAYNVVKEGLGDTAHTIVKVASKEHEQKGISGAVGGVLRQIPPTVVRPIILVAEATSNVLDGFRSQIEPEFKKENEEKWKET